MSFEKKQIARQFSRAATTYDEVAALQSVMADRLIKRIPLAAEGLLVDLGCGTGAAIESLASQTRLEFIGLDLSPGMIAQAQLRLRNVRNVTLLERDLERTRLATKCAEIVFSNAAIQWCDSRLAMAEMARVLRPGGRLLVSTFGPQTLCEWKAAWQAIGDSAPRVHPLEPMSVLQKNLVDAGFDRWTAESKVHHAEFSSIGEMLASIKRLGATNASRDRETGLLGREKFLKLKNHFQEQQNDQGFLKLSFECFYLYAIRSS